MRLADKVREERIKSIRMRQLAQQADTYDKQVELRKQQEGTYKKYMFFKNLSNVKCK